jgi:hypothetical protein
VSAFPRRGRTRATLVVLVVIAATAVSAATAAAPIFKPGESVGRFKILSGHFNQDVGYTASYKTTPSSEDECWTYIFNDNGSATFDLSFEKGEVSRMRFRDGAVSFSPRLKVTGSVARKWNSQIQNTAGPHAGSSYCKAAAFPPPAPGDCGTRDVKEAPSGLSVGLLSEKGVYGQGQDAVLFGTPLLKDPFTNCPSDTTYVLFPLDAESTDGAAQLDDAKVGETVTLHGRGQFNSSKKKDFIVPFEWISGSQLVHMNWTLVLKRVKEAKG